MVCGWEINDSLSLRYNGHFPDEPGLAGVYWSKGWWRWSDNWTTGAISRAKLQSNIITNKTTSGFFTGLMPFLSPNQQCQSTEGKSITFRGLVYPKLTWVHPTLWPLIAPGYHGILVVIKTLRLTSVLMQSTFGFYLTSLYSGYQSRLGRVPSVPPPKGLWCRAFGYGLKQQFFYMPDVFPAAQPTVSKHWNVGKDG